MDGDDQETFILLIKGTEVDKQRNCSCPALRNEEADAAKVR